MSLALLTPRQALKKHNKPFLKVQPFQSDIDKFKANLVSLFDHSRDGETEEYHKNLTRDFLRATYYGGRYYINTKGRNDLVVHLGPTAESNVGIIVETKSPTNKYEMVSRHNLNVKAMWELLYYFFEETVSNNNLDLKHLVVTNTFEWFIFDAAVFHQCFGSNKTLLKFFLDFKSSNLFLTRKEEFYIKIAKPAIEAVQAELEFTYFDLREKEGLLRAEPNDNDAKLISLYKILSPTNLLKLPIPNISNTLNTIFYSELLHIIGLEEVKEKSQKLIKRKAPHRRNPGSLLENTIRKLKSSDKLTRLDNPEAFGSNEEEQYFGLALELVITWINRILFLKLLEAQLITFNKGDQEFAFLDHKNIFSFNELHVLFFEVLAVPQDRRETNIGNKFAKVPYLNSSLFELTELEQICIEINQLDDTIRLPLNSSSILTNKYHVNGIATLEYLFTFLNAYDFSNVSSEEIKKDQRFLINSSVLGLIYEKINGYKDGSFFTPGFITMYMCREVLQNIVVQKFNEAKGWQCKSLIDVHNKISDIEEANLIVDSLKICDPAVGSGHFLVSALNEIISIKSELRILADTEGKLLRNYSVDVVDDELLVTDDEGDIHVYTPKNPESRRLQETLFTEKKNIIERSLFGVDINHNSVKICRLRLWIELLKHAYYTTESNYRELETLPNIDINIKTGNSLLSKYSLESDIRPILKKVKWSIADYKTAISNYQNASSKNEKKKMYEFITSIKKHFSEELTRTDRASLSATKYKLDLLINQPRMFEATKVEEIARKKEQRDLEIWYIWIILGRGSH